jgi:hypothetical protein
MLTVRMRRTRYLARGARHTRRRINHDRNKASDSASHAQLGGSGVGAVHLRHYQRRVPDPGLAVFSGVCAEDRLLPVAPGPRSAPVLSLGFS